jgi:hypothetical protein
MHISPGTEGAIETWKNRVAGLGNGTKTNEWRICNLAKSCGVLVKRIDSRRICSIRKVVSG